MSEDQLLHTIEGMTRMSELPDEPEAKLVVGIDPEELEKLKVIGEHIQSVVSAFRAMAVALAPAMRAVTEALAKIEREHGDLLRAVEAWEPVTTAPGYLRHKDTGVVMPLDVARATIQHELARRQKATREVYETEVEPACGREGCPEVCDESCDAGVTDCCGNPAECQRDCSMRAEPS
jgi:hypothetical protein